MTNPTNEELAEALRSIEGLPLVTQLVIRLAANRLYDGDGWIEWNGQIRPTIFKPGQIVETRHRNGTEFTGVEAWPWEQWPTEYPGFWVHDGDRNDIIAYKIVGAP